MVSARDRTYTIPSGGVHDVYANGSLFSHTLDTTAILRSRCQDIQGAANLDHNLTITRTDLTGLVPLGGTVPTGSFAGTNYSGGWYAGFEVLAGAHLPVDLSSNVSAELTRAITRTNPSRPGVTPLTLLQDLIDIPRMLKDVGRLATAPRSFLSSKELANRNLAVQFGWLPLIQDVKSLIDFQSTLHRRTEELNRLYSGTGLHRRIRLGSAGASDSASHNVGTGQGLAGTTLQKRFTRAERWASVRWKPTIAPPYYPKDADRIEQARKVASGFTVEGLFDGAWDLLPWSFVVDWFTNIHGFALAHSDTIPALPYSACLMTHTSTVSDFVTTPSPGNFLIGGNGSAVYETKERFVGSASINAFLPLFGLDRLSIIGSLFIQKFKG